MAVYREKGCKTYTMDFRYAGVRVRESTRTRSKTLAEQAERKRKYELEHGIAGVGKRVRPLIFAVAAQQWAELRKPTLAGKTALLEQGNLKHLLPAFGKLLVTDIEGRHISKYQADRLAEGASPRTVNLEIGSLRNILKRHGVWARIQPSVRMLSAAESAGKALTSEEERKLLDACAKSRSRSLSPFVTLALESGARFGTLKDLHWSQIDFAGQSITLGHDKTRWGSYRTIPLSARALATLDTWAAEFSDREPQDFVFPSERYGGGGRKDRFGFEMGTSVAYSIDRGKPMGTFKTAWNAARKMAGLSVRFHDLRHSAATRMFAAGTPLPVVARILGWSPSQAVLMSARYSHFSLEALRSAVERISGAGSREVQTGSPGLSPGLAASKVFTIH